MGCNVTDTVFVGENEMSGLPRKYIKQSCINVVTAIEISVICRLYILCIIVRLIINSIFLRQIQTGE